MFEEFGFSCSYYAAQILTCANTLQEDIVFLKVMFLFDFLRRCEEEEKRSKIVHFEDYPILTMELCLIVLRIEAPYGAHPL